MVKEDLYWLCFEVVQSAIYHRGIYCPDSWFGAQREPCLPQLLSWRLYDVGAHLVVKEATVNVARLVVLFSVHAREVRLTKKSKESVPVDDDNDDEL